MFDINQIKSTNDIQEILHAVSQQLGTVIANETTTRISTESAQAERNAIGELLKRMEQLSHLRVVSDLPGIIVDEKIARQQRSALIVRDLLTQLDEFPKKGVGRRGSSEFSPDLIAAIYYGHMIFTAAEGERRDLMKYLPVTQPAAPAPVIDAGKGKKP